MPHVPEIVISDATGRSPIFNGEKSKAVKDAGKNIIPKARRAIAGPQRIISSMDNMMRFNVAS
jgi:hypothetical protein